MENNETQKPQMEQKKVKHRAQQKSCRGAESPKAVPFTGAGMPAQDSQPKGASPQAAGETISQEEIAQLRKKAAEYDELLDQCKRIKAEYVNYQKRIEKKKAEWSECAKREFILKILPVIDDIYRTGNACSSAHDAGSIRTGVEILCGSAGKILEGLGVKQVNSVGEKFDPSLHEALATQPTDRFPEGTVVSEVESGYRIGDILLRAAKVVVSVKPQTQVTAEEDRANGNP